MSEYPFRHECDDPEHAPPPPDDRMGQLARLAAGLFHEVSYLRWLVGRLLADLGIRPRDERLRRSTGSPR